MIALLVGVFVANAWGHAGVSSIAARGRRLRAMKARCRCPWRARGQRVETRCPRSRDDHTPPAKGASLNHASSRRLDTVSATMRRPARLMSLRFWAPTVSVLALAFPPTALGTPAGSSVRATQSQSSRSSTGGRLEDAPLLAPGSGYASPHGSGPVRTLQRRLAAAGYPPGPIDGRYGPLTEGAVIRFQAAPRPVGRRHRRSAHARRARLAQARPASGRRLRSGWVRAGPGIAASARASGLPSRPDRRALRPAHRISGDPLPDCEASADRRDRRPANAQPPTPHPRHFGPRALTTSSSPAATPSAHAGHPRA